MKRRGQSSFVEAKMTLQRGNGIWVQGAVSLESRWQGELDDIEHMWNFIFVSYGRMLDSKRTLWRAKCFMDRSLVLEIVKKNSRMDARSSNERVSNERIMC